MGEDRVARDIREFAGTYSGDVEIGADGKLYYARDVEKGEVICIPMHMRNKVHKR